MRKRSSKPVYNEDDDEDDSSGELLDDDEEEVGSDGQNESAAPSDDDDIGSDGQDVSAMEESVDPDALMRGEIDEELQGEVSRQDLDLDLDD